MLLPVFAFVLLEIGLRVAGFGYPTGFFVEKELQGRRKLVDNPKFGRRYFPSSMARAPEPLLIDPVKAPGTVRIVVLGESAAMGDPEPAFGFPRILEVLLREAYPENKIEVINAACTAINSHAVLSIAKDCQRLQADFWVIYMGNNEVVGPYGPGTIFGWQGAPSLRLIRASLWCKTWKLAQLTERIRTALTRSQGGKKWQGMEMFMEKVVRHDDPKMKVVYKVFECNLRDILNAGKRAGAKTLLCTVAANLQDCPPFASLHRVGIKTQEEAEWTKKVNAGAELAAAGKHELALKEYEAALKLDGEFAELPYRIGQSHQALGHFEQAQKSFQEALDLDALRFRVDSRLNGLTRDTARDRTAEGIYLLDTEAMLANASPGKISGKEFLLEHVHFNFAGNYRVARGVAGQLTKLWPGQREPKTEWLNMEEAGRRLAFTDWNRYKILQEMQRRWQRSPFTGQLGHPQRMDELARQLQELEKSKQAEVLKTGIAQARAAVTAWPDNWRLVANLGSLLQESENWPEALSQWQRVIELLPHHPQAYFSCGTALYHEGKIEEAIGYYQRALEIKPNSSEALNELANCYLALNRLDEALAKCRQALLLEPEDPDLHYNLGIILARKGQIENALKEYRKTLEISPSHTAAAIKMGNLLATQKRLSEAEEVFVQFIQRVPEDTEVHQNYGAMLGREGRYAEAMAQFEFVLQRNPNHVEARFNLASALMAQKKYQEAIAQFEKVRVLRPDWPLLEQMLEKARRKQRGE